MREIKFRAWDTKAKMFYNPTYEGYNGKIEELFLQPSGSLCMRRNTEIYHESTLKGRFVISQFTGLHDKNGVEIYEGDIIATKFFPAYVQRISWQGAPDAVGEVYWDFSQFGLKAKGEKDFRYPSMCEINFQETEVIGNIHQNPDLCH